MKQVFALLLLLLVAAPSLAIEKNTSGQYLELQAIDSSSGAPKTGDAANLTAYQSTDGGTLTQLADTSATEISSTNAPGIYRWDLASGETNGTNVLYSAKSTTGGIYLVPRFVATTPPNFAKASVDSNGRLDLIKIAGTTQTARDLGLSVLLSSGTGTGQVKLSGGYFSPNWGDVGNPTTTVNLSGTTISVVNDLSGTAGQIGTIVDAVTDGTYGLSAAHTERAAIKAKTDLLPGTSPWAALLTDYNTSGTFGYLIQHAFGVSPFIVDDDHTWSFDSRTQITSPDLLAESVGEATIYKAVDFSEALTANGSIASIGAVTVADVGGATEPTITSSAISPDKKKVHLTINGASATASTYTISVAITSTDSRTFTRKVKLILQ